MRRNNFVQGGQSAMRQWRLWKETCRMEQQHITAGLWKELSCHRPKYDGFCTVPNHLNYQKEIEGFLNLYEPIEHKPQQGTFLTSNPWCGTSSGNNKLGMDYMQLLYLQPTQKLPIVLLVSEERNTGKSTFLNFWKPCLRTTWLSTPTRISEASSIPTGQESC